MTDAEREARIQAVAHLSAAHAQVQCAFEALVEAGVNPLTLPVNFDHLNAWLEIAADGLFGPEHFYLLQRVEKVTADGVGGMHEFRVAAVRALVEQAHQEREVAK